MTPSETKQGTNQILWFFFINTLTKNNFWLRKIFIFISESDEEDTIVEKCPETASMGVQDAGFWDHLWLDV